MPAVSPVRPTVNGTIIPRGPVTPVAPTSPFAPVGPVNASPYVTSLVLVL